MPSKDREMSALIIIVIVFVVCVVGLVYWTERVRKDQTMLVTQITIYPNRVSIFSFENEVYFARIPFGDSMDLLRIIEPGKTYRIIFSGFEVFSVEEVR